MECPPEGFHTFHVSALTCSEFHELDKLGTTPAPACSRCVGCTDCTFRRKRLSREDSVVVRQIEESMKIDKLTGVISTQYPWKPCVTQMVDDERQAR